MNFAPIALFAYARLDHTRRTIEALRRNDGAAESDLYIFADGPKGSGDEAAVAEVRDYLRSVSGFKSVRVVEQAANRGLAQSIIDGVTEVIGKHGRVIVIEDDIVTAPGALLYFNRALEHFRDHAGVFSIAGYSPPPSVMPLPEDYDYDVFCVPRMLCWGWATWKDRWDKADWKARDLDGLLASPSQKRAYAHWIGQDSLGTLQAWAAGRKDVWACRWVFAHFRHHAVCVCPVVSYVDNIGLDGSGANCGVEHRLRVDLDRPRPETLRLPPTAFVDDRIHAAFMAVYDPAHRKPAAAAAAGSAAPAGQARNAGGRPAVLGGLRLANPARLKAALQRRLKDKLVSLAEDVLRRLGNRSPVKLVRLGTAYGGWQVPETGFCEGDVVLSAGAGEDISFDIELARRFGCRVHVLDPTPRAVEHFETTKRLIESGQKAPINNSKTEFYEGAPGLFDRLAYHPVGLWKKNTTMRFYAPRNAAHVSHSIGNLHGMTTGFDAVCERIADFAARNGIHRVKVLKMDIEGAEFAVIRDMLRSRVRPEWLLVEFHPGQSRWERNLKLKTILHTALLRLFNYRLVSRRGWDFVFMRTGA
jgi:FkbM family methyltransferase